MEILLIYKKAGQTPLEAIEEAKMGREELKGQKISYAGRLDPLAEGALLLVYGDIDEKEKQKYLKLPKEYVFSVLFGVLTDTFDPLGLIEQSSNKKVLQKDVEQAINGLGGKKKQQFPPFSSKTVSGKSLFQWAKEEKLNEIEIPSKEIEVLETEFLGLEEISKDHLKKEIEERINLVKGDFRQIDILNGWESFFLRTEKSVFQIAKVRIKATSGTYVRSLSVDIGEKLGLPSLALRIKRTKIGEFEI